jgi:hypothetical protein
MMPSFHVYFVIYAIAFPISFLIFVIPFRTWGEEGNVRLPEPRALSCVFAKSHHAAFSVRVAFIQETHKMSVWIALQRTITPRRKKRI